MKLINRFLTRTVEETWNYEYETKEEFVLHRQEMTQRGVMLDTSYRLNNGKIIAAYVEVESECLPLDLPDGEVK